MIRCQKCTLDLISDSVSGIRVLGLGSRLALGGYGLAGDLALMLPATLELSLFLFWVSCIIAVR